MDSQNIYNAFYLPPELKDNIGNIHTKVQKDITINFLKITPEEIRKIAKYLKQRGRESLKKIPIEKIIDVIDKASTLWMEKKFLQRTRCIDGLTKILPFSRQMIELSLDEEMGSSLKAHLELALKNEFGKREFLDGFSYNSFSKGYTYCKGPELTGGIFSANIPGLPHLTVIRALLVKSPCLGRLSQIEPLFLPLYMETVAGIDRDIGNALACLYFPHEDRALLEAFYNSIDFLIAYGGIESINQIKEDIPKNLKAIFHEHKLGFGVIDRTYLASDKVKGLAMDVAFDATIFDQFACLAPHIYFLETGGEIGAKEFAKMVFNALAELEKKYPSAAISPEELGTTRMIIEELQIKKALGEEIEILFPEGKLNYVVVVQSCKKFEVSPLKRFLRIVPVSKIDDVFNYLETINGFLQNCGCAIDEKRKWDFYKNLAKMGVSRISRPGLMGTPSMIWHHDGVSCLSAMCSFTDVEFTPPAELMGE